MPVASVGGVNFVRADFVWVHSLLAEERSGFVAEMTFRRISGGVFLQAASECFLEQGQGPMVDQRSQRGALIAVEGLMKCREIGCLDIAEDEARANTREDVAVWVDVEMPVMDGRSVWFAMHGVWDVEEGRSTIAKTRDCVC